MERRSGRSRPFEAVIEQARAIPGVRAAAITSQVPRGRGGNGNGLIPEGRTIEAASAIGSRLRMVTPGYFDAMGIPLTRGRALNDQDHRGALKVMVISEALAHAAWPNLDPIGRRIACCEPGPDGNPDFKTVVGVAGEPEAAAAGVAPPGVALVGNAILLCFVLAEIAKSGTQLVLYRKGAL